MEYLNNLPPFYIGQKVIAIKTHSQGTFIKGVSYKVTNYIKCDCGVWWISVGGTTDRINRRCTCGHLTPTYGLSHGDSRLLAPIQEQTFPLISYSKVLEQETVIAN
jgi:hypothetical protein